jgi:hypothetical protein
MHSNWVAIGQESGRKMLRKHVKSFINVGTILIFKANIIGYTRRGPIFSYEFPERAWFI